MSSSFPICARAHLQDYSVRPSALLSRHVAPLHSPDWTQMFSARLPNPCWMITWTQSSALHFLLTDIRLHACSFVKEMVFRTLLWLWLTACEEPNQAKRPLFLTLTARHSALVSRIFTWLPVAMTAQKELYKADRMCAFWAEFALCCVFTVKTLQTPSRTRSHQGLRSRLQTDIGPRSRNHVAVLEVKLHRFYRSRGGQALKLICLLVTQSCF